MWYAYDYAYMMLAHSAALLINLSQVGLCGLQTPNSNSGGSFAGSPNTAVSGVERNLAMRYCGMAITAMVESNRSSNFFPLDMSGNLSLIAKETGMILGDWINSEVVQRLEARAAE